MTRPETMPDEDAGALLSFLLQDQNELRRRFQATDAESGLLTRKGEDPEVQWYELLRNVLWKVFSDNNEVAGPDGRVYDLGSWRGSGGFIAAFLNARLAEEGLTDASPWTDRPFQYIDFYMGLMRPGDEALHTLYVHFFERLKARGCTWRYAPPAIFLVRFDSPDEEQEEEDPSSYDPSAAVLDELQEQEDEAGEDALLHDVNEGNEEAHRRAVDEPPQIVLAYREVYDEMPPYLRHDER